MPEFSSPLLIGIITKAARRVNRKLCLCDTPDEIVIDPSTGNILSPDDDCNLYDIVLLQAECIIAQREYQTELRGTDGGVLVRDGEQTVDTRGAGVARGTFFNSQYGPCEELAQAIKMEKMNRSGGEGKLVW